VRELAEDFHDFAGSFAACRDYNYVSFGVTAYRVLENRLARSEGTGGAECSACATGKNVSMMRC
jgi:hypothetical protein